MWHCITDKIGQNIKEYREKNQLTQEQLASIVHINRTTLSRYESGNRVPCLEVLWLMADCFEISIDELVGRV